MPWWLWGTPIGVLVIWFIWLFWWAAPVTRQAMKSTAVISPAVTASAPARATSATPIEVTMADLGQAGDMFGGLNTLFAGLAFSFVAIAAWFQRRTLLAQYVQIKAAREQQRLAEFEPLFFQLISLFRDLRSQAVDVKYPNSGTHDGTLSGLGVTGYVRSIAVQVLGGDLTTVADMAKAIDKAYSDFYQQNEQILGPMFRTLYHVFRLVSQSGLDEKHQVRYANIARGLLGGDFLLLLMLNCLSRHGRGFKPYVELFGLLKHVREPLNGDNVDTKMAKLFYSQSARGNYSERLEFWKTNSRPVLPN